MRSSESRRYARDALADVAPQLLQRSPKDVMVDSEHGSGVRTRLCDDELGLAYDQEGAMGLDRAGEMDLLQLAIGEIRLAERRGGGCQRNHDSCSTLNRLRLARLCWRRQGRTGSA
jgi:hypothetical protein